MQDFKIIHFSLGGLQLQEPSTFISDIILAIVCFILFFKTYRLKNEVNVFFLRFFLFLGVSTFLGAFGHVLFYYGGKPGKFPSWIFASVATFYFCKAMIDDVPLFFNKRWKSILWFKGVGLLILSLIFSNFIFITLDTVLSYLIFGGAFGTQLWRASRDHMRFIVYGTIVLIPSAFVFVLDVNLHSLFNKDDLSHFIIMLTIILYYKAIVERSKTIIPLV